jgi:glutaredoxin 3
MEARMADAEVILFATPTCPTCQRAEEALRQRGIRYRRLDVSADPEALAQLLRFAGQPTVPTIVAYGEVMVGLDLARLDHMTEGLDARADAFARSDAEDEEQLRESEAIVQAAIEKGGMTPDEIAEIEGLPEE